METVSVSKGVFSIKAYTFGGKKIKNENEYCNKPWFRSYKQIYQTIQDSIERINYTMYKQILEDLYWYVDSISNGTMSILSSEIPTAILLAGMNVPDHIKLFDNVKDTLGEITPFIATISSKNCSNLKSMVEESIYQLINANSKDDPIIKKINCTFRALCSWYDESNTDNIPLVIVIRDFENFNAKVLHDFVYNLSMYSRMKIVLILGIATSLHIVHRTLSYDVTSKLRIKVFSTQTQLLSLAHIVDGIVFANNVPFKLTGNAFKFLEEMFLFYDLSVDGFLQAFKICLATHYFGNNFASLCCDINNVEEILKSCTSEEMQEFRELPSIANCLKGKQCLDDKNFKIFLKKVVIDFQNYMFNFLSVLKCLHAFADSCPCSPLGKHFRQIYGTAVSSKLTESDNYTKVLQYLLHLPKEEFLAKITQVLEVAEKNKNHLPKNFKSKLEENFEILQEASEVVLPSSNSDLHESPKNDKSYNKRSDFHNSLRDNAHKQTYSPYKQARKDFVDYLDEIFSIHLKNPTKVAGFEIFCFHDIKLVNRQIKGSLRAAIESALKDPKTSLQCHCCKMNNEEEILRTMPDLSIIYKLHTESKKFINMYDWLQSFLTIIDPEQVDEQREIDPIINSRFSQAVAELQFLGYIKGTKMKTDHVKKLA